MYKSLNTIAISIAIIVGCAAAHRLRVIGDASGVCGDTATWTLDSKSRTFTLDGNGAVDTICDINNPIMVDKIVIGDGVTSIDFPIFADWANVKSVTIGRSLSHIESSAFEGCSHLEEFIVKGNPNFSVIDGVLFDKSATTLMIFPTGKVGSYDIPAGVETIADNAFTRCQLTSMSIPESLSSIPSGAFRTCWLLTKLEVDENNKYYTAVDNVLFNKEKTALVHISCGMNRTSYTVPDGVESVDSFYMCHSISSVTLPDSVTTIGNFTFHDCDYMNTVNVPASVSSIGFGAFSMLGRLTNINVHKDNQHFSQIDGVLFDKEGKTLLRYACGKGSRYTIPDGVEAIGEYAFAECRNLESVTIPDGVTTIEDGAFAGCLNLKTLSISKSVTTIGEQALRGCSSLKSITVDNENPAFSSIDDVLFDKLGETLIRYPCSKDAFISGNTTTHNYTLPDSVKTIKAGAFSRCELFNYIKIGESLEEIDPHLFSESLIFDTIEVSDKNQHFTSIDGVLYDKDVKALKLFPRAKEGIYVLPDTVESIGTCFAGSEVGAVTIDANVSAIEPFAFARCNELQSVIYMGTEDPGVNTHYVFFESLSLNHICVTSDYTPSTFCGETVEREMYKCIYTPPIYSSSNLVVPSALIVLVVSAILAVIF